MNDQAPLRHVTSSRLARLLLVSAQHDEPAAGAMQRALSGLGFAPVGLLAASAGATVSKSAAAATTAGSGVAAASKGGALVLAKWAGFGLVGSLLGLGAVELALKPGPVAVPAAPVVAFALPSPRLRVTEPAPEPARVTHDVSPALRLPHGSAAGTTQHEPAQVEPAPSSGSFDVGSASADVRVQVAALAAVRRALASHEPARALELLEEFAHLYPASVLSEEALVLRVEALRDAGRSAECRALGTRFLRERPSSVYAARIERAVEIP